MTSQQNHLFESLGLPSDALTNQVKYIRSVRNGISGEVVKHAVKILGTVSCLYDFLAQRQATLIAPHKQLEVTG